MKYIPEYYTDRAFPIYQKLPTGYAEQVENDCEHYKQHIINAIKEAHALYIAKHSKKDLLYSRTWGK